MKVEATTTNYKGDTGIFWNGYPPEFCCDDMQEAWGGSYGCITAGDVNEYEMNAICISDVSVYPEGSYTKSLPINFCPFCGEKIEIEVT